MASDPRIPFIDKPRTPGIHLTGKLNGWATPKDLILHLAGKLTVRVSIADVLILIKLT